MSDIKKPDKPVYKVVRKVASGQDKGYWSCLAFGAVYELKYTIGKTTNAVPESLGIMAFDALHKAESFARDINNAHNGSSTGDMTVAVLEVTGKRSKKQPMIVGNYLDIPGFYATLHKLMEAHHVTNITGEIVEIFTTFGYTSGSPPPEGTVFMDRVTPVREIAGWKEGVDFPD